MCDLCRIRIDKIWKKLATDQRFNTPSERANFYINNIAHNRVIIITENNTRINIQKEAFAATLNYLISNGHNIENPCEIRSNNDPQLAGPLCTAARQENNNIRCINYILPILAQYQMVGIDGTRPNKTWFLSRESRKPKVPAYDGNPQR